MLRSSADSRPSQKPASAGHSGPALSPCSQRNTHDANEHVTLGPSARGTIRRLERGPPVPTLTARDPTAGIGRRCVLHAGLRVAAAPGRRRFRRGAVPTPPSHRLRPGAGLDAQVESIGGRTTAELLESRPSEPNWSNEVQSRRAATIAAPTRVPGRLARPDTSAGGSACSRLRAGPPGTSARARSPDREMLRPEDVARPVDRASMRRRRLGVPSDRSRPTGRTRPSP
jgi:hypothetical protein